MSLMAGTAKPARIKVEAKADRRLQKGLLVLLIGVVIWFLPVPHGLKPAAWHLFGVFVATLVGLIINPLPLGAMALASLTFCGLSGLFTPADALSGFGSTTIWLIISAFLFARSFLKTGLGRRIAYLMIREIGGSTLKLGYALVFSIWWCRLSSLLPAPVWADSCTQSPVACAAGFSLSPDNRPGGWEPT